ncbi:MAG: glycoside hydrolase family 3 N-terminal domain-containing protein [Planctomycetota bacterium]
MTDTPRYKDPHASLDQRVDDLLGRMTLDEKVGQMLQLDGRKDPQDGLRRYHPGSFLHVIDETAGELQQAAATTRLGIPLLFGIDAIHGHSFWPGATIFPTQLGLACSWNPELARQVGRITAREMSTTGLHWTFAPVLCLARDLRWGRIDESFGEDSLLIGDLAAAMTDGLQGEGPSDRRGVLACAKHYAGYSETHGGRDATEADLSRRKMHSYFLPPFRRATHAATYMVGYQAIDGVPCTANRWLLTEVLREAWGFEGFTVTDWNNVGALIEKQHVAADIAEAATMAVTAGCDMIMNTPAFYDGALEAIGRGDLDEALIDQAVRRILRVKFALGLFEDPRLPDPARRGEFIATDEHQAVNLQAARESIVLVRNTGTLPLAPQALKKVAVIGPNADDPVTQLGDWSLGTGQAGKGGHPRECITTVLDGLRARLSGEAEVVSARGCNVTDDNTSGIDEAVRAAKAADVAVVVVGDQLPFIGEARSTATLELQGAQQALLEAVHATGTPMVVVLLASKPLAVEWIDEHAAAVLVAFNPGMAGGQAVAEVLCGDINPSGKLPISFARHAGQQPVYYNQLPGQHGTKYADLTQEPLYRFGTGLSYTTFAYSNLTLHKETIAPGEPVAFTVDVANTGDRDGVEIVQVYLRDLVTSVTWPLKMLKAYRRVALRAGRTETVAFTLDHDALALVDADGQRVVEPGDFELYVGGASADEDLLTARFTVGG